MDPVIELYSPLTVDFEVTNRCPYGCCFCESDSPHAKSRAELSTKQCFGVLEKLAEAGVLNIFITGGDPLLRSDLSELISYCFYLGLEPFTSTNALYLDPGRLESLIRAGLNRLQVSLQAPGTVHDSIVKKPGSYSRVTKNLEIAIKKGIELEVVCVGLKENIKHIPELIKEIGNIGIKYFRVLRFIPAHRKEMLKYIPPRKEVEGLVPKLIKVAEKSNVQLLLGFCPGLAVPPNYLLEGTHPSTVTCGAGKIELTILPNGDVYPCTEFKNMPEWRVGNILTESVEQLWNHPMMVMLRTHTPKDYTGICAQCDGKWTCYSARCVAYNLTGDLFGDDLSCYIVRERLGLEV